MAKSQTYTVKTTITKSQGTYGIGNEYNVLVEGSGFEGEGKGFSLSSAFEKAYEDLMAKVSEAIFQNDK